MPLKLFDYNTIKLKLNVMMRNIKLIKYGKNHKTWQAQRTMKFEWGYSFQID